MMIGHEYLHTERNSQLSLCGKCNIPLKGNEINQAPYKPFTLRTNHHSNQPITMAPPTTARASYWFLPAPRYFFFFFLTNQTQIKVGELSNRDPKICPELAVVQFKCRHFDRNGITVYCYTSGVSRPSWHSWGQIFSHVFGPQCNT